MWLSRTVTLFQNVTFTMLHSKTRLHTPRAKWCIRPCGTVVLQYCPWLQWRLLSMDSESVPCVVSYANGDGEDVLYGCG